MEKNKKELKQWIAIILVAIVAYWGINNLSTVGNILGTIFNIVFPFILGGFLAFILNIPMTFFENKLSKNKKTKKNIKKKAKGKGLRILSIIFAIVVIVLVLTLIVRLIVPELIGVVKLLIENIPYYTQELIKFIGRYIEDTQDINNIIQEINIDTENLTKQITALIPSVLTSSISIVSSIISGITTFFIAIVFAIYILIDKEKLQMQATKLLNAYLSKQRVEKIINIGRVTKNTFKKFFTVQCLEATILGTLCMIGMLILKIPYAVSIGVLIGVTALIPVVGAFIGVIVGAVLILAVNPIKVITFVIFVLVLQQIEGNFIYPRVVGSSVGLPGMWVLFAVSVGGSIGGVVGMLIGVPVATVVYTLIKNDISKKTAINE